MSAPLRRQGEKSRRRGLLLPIIRLTPSLRQPFLSLCHSGGMGQGLGVLRVHTKFRTAAAAASLSHYVCPLLLAKIGTYPTLTRLTPFNPDSTVTADTASNAATAPASASFHFFHPRATAVARTSDIFPQVTTSPPRPRRSSARGSWPCLTPRPDPAGLHLLVHNRSHVALEGAARVDVRCTYSMVLSFNSGFAVNASFLACVP